jgi:hypothetical protein
MKDSYAPVHELSPNYHRRSPLLQSLWPKLRPQALPAQTHQSALGSGLLTVWIKRFEHTATQNFSLASPADFLDWIGTRIFIPGSSGSISGCLHSQTHYRSKWSFTANVPGSSTRSITSCLDDAAGIPEEHIQRNLQLDFQKETQGQTQRTLKAVGTSDTRRCGTGNIGSRILVDCESAWFYWPCWVFSLLQNCRRQCLRLRLS